MNKVAAIAVALVSLFLPIPRAGAQTKPNIILVLLDNFGYGELGAYGGGVRRGAATPRIDSLAREGMRLTNFNTEQVCTASRSALLTGRFAIRSGTHVLAQGPDDGLVQWEVTLAEMLRDAGYVSAHLGKWHLGNRPGRLPTDQGFDEWYGILRSNDEAMWTSSVGYDPQEAPPPHTYAGRTGEPTREIALYDLDMRARFDGEITRRALDFIQREAKSGKPFFAYLPMTTGHFPTIPSPSWKGRTGHGDWADVLAQLDHYIGELLDAVDKAGIARNTIFILTADNGADWVTWNRGWAGPWRGSYNTGMEGGLRVPFLVRWPGKIPAGADSDEIVHLVDLFPTLARIAGGKVPEDRAIDGVDQLDFLLGRQVKSNRDFFPVYGEDGEILAVKWKNWKFHFKERTFGEEPLRESGKLVNLYVDPQEERSVIIENTWVWPALKKRLDAFHATLKRYPPIRPGTPDPYDPPPSTGPGGPGR